MHVHKMKLKLRSSVLFWRPFRQLAICLTFGIRHETLYLHLISEKYFLANSSKLFNVSVTRNNTDILTHSFLMHPFSTPWKHQETLRSSDVFQGVEKECIGNEWVNMKNNTNMSKINPKQIFRYVVGPNIFELNQLDWIG